MTTGLQERPAAEAGEGILSRLAAAVYRYLVLGLFLAGAGAPTVVLWTLLARQPENVALFVAALLPIAPALSAALYAQRAWSVEPDLHPTRALRRGLVANTLDVVKWWSVVLVLGVVLVVNIVFAEGVPGGELLRPVCVVLLVGLVAWSGHLMVISSFFSFRLRDALRLAAVVLFARWSSSLGFLSLALVTAAVIALTSEAVLLLLGWAFAGMLWLIARPVQAYVTERFTTRDDA